MPDTGTGESVFTTIGAEGVIGSELLSLLMADQIVPGSGPSYQLCKTIYSYHPLGAILADAPITRAQSQPRIISIPVPGEQRLIKAFDDEWETIAKVGATALIHSLMSISRIYGIGSIGVGERGKSLDSPFDIARVDSADLFFNILDPLNTAGSLVLNQDPNSPDFLKQTVIQANGQSWHPSRTLAKMNEQPLYIDWTSSAFGFVGRSVYQRALYPLKTYVQTMITDQMVAQKVGLLVAKMKMPGSFINNVMQSMFGWKRQAIKSGVTGQVLSIGIDEAVESLNFQNLDGPYKITRENVLKNIASAAGMPASIIAQETLTEGFGEGTEDAKKEAAYLDHVRTDMQPAYAFMDRIIMRRAWNRDFYEAFCNDYPNSEEYETWLHQCMLAFEATWPNVLQEPDSEKSKTQDVQFKAVIALLETLLPAVDPENKVRLIEWAAENANEREELFAAMLDFDPLSLRSYLEEQKEREAEMAEKEPEEPATFAERS